MSRLIQIREDLFMGGIPDPGELSGKEIGLIITTEEEKHLFGDFTGELFTVPLKEGSILSDKEMDKTVEKAVGAISSKLCTAVISGNCSSSYLCVCILNALGTQDPFWRIFRACPDAFGSGLQYNMASWYISSHTPERKGDRKTEKLLKKAERWDEEGDEAREKLKKRYLKGKNRSIIEKCTEVKYRNVERVWDERSREWEEYVSLDDTLKVCPWDEWLRDEILSDNDPESLERRCFRSVKEAEMALRKLVGLDLGSDELYIAMMHRGISEYIYLEHLKKPESFYLAAVWPYQTELELWVRSTGIRRLEGYDELLYRVAEKGIWGLNMVYDDMVRLLWYAALSIGSPDLRKRLSSYIADHSREKNGVVMNRDFDYVRYTGTGERLYRLSEMLDRSLEMTPEEQKALRDTVASARHGLFPAYELKDLLKEVRIPRWPVRDDD